jgi:putative copper export protein
VLVLIALCMGARIRLMLYKTNGGTPEPRTTLRWLRAESLTMLIVLALSAVLANASIPDSEASSIELTNAITTSFV